MAKFRHVGYVKDGSNARSFYIPTDISMNFAAGASEMRLRASENGTQLVRSGK
jgi:hypothetical protein